MARRKQSSPKRPKRANSENSSDDEEQNHRVIKRPYKPPAVETEYLLLPEIGVEDGKEVAEISLNVTTTSASGFPVVGKGDALKHLALRVRLQLPMNGRANSPQDLVVQVVVVNYDGSHADDAPATKMSDDSEHLKIILCGQLDGSNAALSALTYLICEGWCSLRPAPCLTCAMPCCLDHDLSGRLRVVLTKGATLSKYSALRQRKALRMIMFWLRPELVSEMRSKGVRSFSEYDEEVTENLEQMADDKKAGKKHVFDPSSLYDAVKPSQTEPGLDLCSPELLPELRPYQRRAAFWMVQRERGLGARFDSHSHISESSPTTTENQHCPSAMKMNTMTTECFSDEHPLWFTVLPPDGSPVFFFNPYTGAVSCQPRDLVSYVKGGILADEMGLGKTVELLACILANPLKDILTPTPAEAARNLLRTKIAGRKFERVDCSCGAVDDDPQYKESWVQCDLCDAWQHATCVGCEQPAGLGERKDQWILVRDRMNRKKKQARGRMPLNLESQPRHRLGLKLDHLQKRKLRKMTSQIHSDGSRREEEYTCGACAALIGGAEVHGVGKATLIVCPTPIIQQWQEEILRHTRAGSLDVLVYEGVEKGALTIMSRQHATEAKKRVKIVSAHDLAEADIVLTTYDVLRTDLSHNSDKSQSNRELRHIKRYPVVPTPLTRLSWWRVCLDEAQMVESNTAKATEMALRLNTQNSWCVSGTPIQRSLDDLYGLFRFLQAEPFNNYTNWKQALQQPYEAGDPWAMSYMHKFLGMLMWRSSKSHVKDELSLPPQTELLSWLHFSAVEAHFYRQQHEKCAVEARAVIAKFHQQPDQSHGGTHGSKGSSVPQLSNNGPIQSLEDGASLLDVGQARTKVTDPEISLLSNSLLRLRQACCHPQVGNAGIRSLHQRTPMTMDEILQVLVAKAKVEAQEAQRVMISALNGLAALAAIDRDIPLAISIYREALAQAEENAEDVDVDPLQKLHTLQNLADVLGFSSILPHREESANEGAQAKVTPARGTLPGSLDQEMIDEVPVLQPEASPVFGQGAVISEVGEVPSYAKSTKEEKNASTKLRMRSFGMNGQQQPIAGIPVLDSKIPRTLRDDLLIEQCQEIRSKYMVTFHAKLASRLAEFESINQQVCSAKKDCEACGGTNWWLDVLAMAEKCEDEGEDLLYKIKVHLLETDNLGKRGRHRNASSLALRFQEISGLKYVLQGELDAIDSGRDQVIEHLKSLNDAMKNPTPQAIEQIVYCPRHSANMTGTICAHCEMDDLFQMYENRLLLLRTSATEADRLVSAEDAAVTQQRVLAHKRMNGSENLQATSYDQTVDISNDIVRNRRDMTGAAEAEVLRAPSETEQILSILKSHARRSMGVSDVASKHLCIFEVMKKECTQMRALSNIQRDVLYALDEISMATIRLSLLVPGEVIENEIEKLVKLPAEELPQRNVQLTCEKFDALKDFARAKGQLRYLKGLTLARQQESQSRSDSSSKAHATSQQESAVQIESLRNGLEEACPVCRDKLGSQLMVLPCGHLLCCKCCLLMIEQTSAEPVGISKTRIACPTCREPTCVGDIAFVDDGGDRNVIAGQMGQHSRATTDEEASIQVKGSYGTKIESIVRRLLLIKLKDPNSKVLVFSTWNDVLDVIEYALAANKITFARAKNGNRMHIPLQKFRGSNGQSLIRPRKARKTWKTWTTEEQTQVLLLPIDLGGNGLNLVEAQHVILVEPLPSPGVEAQAVNRVHRIGQKQATFIHRFIVSETVEESIYWLSRKKLELGEAFPVTLKNSKSFSLTLKDVGALFTSNQSTNATCTEGNSSEAAPQSSSILSSLSPAAAAAAAAEARLRLSLASQK